MNRSRAKKQAAIRFDAAILRALRRLADRTGRTISDVVTEAVLQKLKEADEEGESAHERHREAAAFFAEAAKSFSARRRKRKP